MPLIIPSNSITGGYEVDNSLRFDDGSSDYLEITPASAGNRQTCTVSAWVKRTNIVNANIIGCWSANNDDDNINITLRNNGELRIVAYTQNWRILDRLFRDVSAWYHIVVAFDTTQSTANDRIKVYINGTQETSFLTINNPSLNADIGFNQASTTRIGTQANALSNYFDGYMAEFCFIDGQALDPTSFGEFDADTGIWKPIDVSGLTFGTNGFYLDFESSGSLGNDVSGNGNNFTVNNLTSIDQTTDTPTNNYATMNPLAVPPSNAPTFSEGNTKISTNTTNANPVLSTIGVSQGKWYVECKRISYDGGTGDDDGFRIGFGVTYVQDVNIVPPAISDSGHYFMIGNGIVYNGATDLGDKAGDSNVSDDGVVGIALDLDNNRISWSFNGAWMTGSNAWSGSSPSSYVSIPSGYTYFFFQQDGSSGRAYTAGWNFGGTSAFTISSGNSDGNGYGNFEYAVPSGYYALNTKNLAEYG